LEFVVRVVLYGVDGDGGSHGEVVEKIEILSGYERALGQGVVGRITGQ
jgi:hypothetical protein